MKAKHKKRKDECKCRLKVFYRIQIDKSNEVPHSIKLRQIDECINYNLFESLPPQINFVFSSDNFATIIE